MNVKAEIRLILVTLMCCMVYAGYGQQAPQYSMYMLNKYQFNPAYAGMDGSLSINGFYRSQWVGILGNPVQQNVNVHMPVYRLDGAFGLSFDHETIGAEETIKGRLSYSYVLDTRAGFFSFGLAAGFTQKALDGAALRAPDGDYEGAIIVHNDDLLPASKVRGAAPEIGLGVYYVGQEFEAGIAMTDFLIGDINMQGATFKGRPAVNISGEYYLEDFGDFDFYPSFLMRTDLAVTQFEVGARAVYEDFVTLGAGLRGYSGTTLDAVTILLGLKVSPNLTVAYGYDISMSVINQVSSGSHEIVVSYNLNKTLGGGVPPPAIYSPRFY